MELGKQIKKYRTEANLSQEGLADKIFVSRQTISNWENDKNYPDIKSLVLMSEVFQVSLDHLIKGDFTFYCGQTRKGTAWMMPKTSSKKFRQKLKDIKVWLYANRDQKLKKLMGMLNLKLTGHYRYYGVSFNGRMISNFKQQVREMLFKVLNRRSNRKSYTREGFIEMLKYYPLVMPKIYVSLF